MAIPCHAISSCTYSCVLTAFDLGNGLWDHSATGLQLQWHSSVPLPVDATSDLHNVDNKLQKRHDKNLLGAEHVRTVVDNIHVQPWYADIEQHVHYLNGKVLQGLSRLCPRQRARPKKPYISDKIWHLRQCKLGRDRHSKPFILVDAENCSVLASLDFDNVNP